MRFFKSRRAATAAAVIVIATAAAAWIEASRASAAPAASAHDVAVSRKASQEERNVREQIIQFYQLRADADTESAGDRAALAALYLERAREGGDFADVLRAEALARKSLLLREAHNSETKLILASALLEQHRFPEALVLAESVLQDDPLNLTHRAVVAEIRLELGDYDGAGSMFNTLWKNRASLVVAPRLARWEEIRGRDDAALGLLESARDTAQKRKDLPRGQLAWFNIRLGEHELRAGRTREARGALRKALQLAPDDPRALTAMARFEASVGNWNRVIEIGERSLEKSVDPEILGLLANACRATGNAERAVEYDRVIDVAFVSKPGPFHRALSLYLLDRRRQIPLVLAKAEDDIATRRDVYGYDVLALALYRSGRIPEARAAMAKALRMGTRDPLLRRHAAEIGEAGKG
ncbi:MAG: tetratricopeptide repeat protein [Gemmatimonadales bacterium]